MVGIPISKVFTVEIKAGYKRGTRVTFPPSKNFPRLVVFTIKEKTNRWYRRSGDDLVLISPVNIETEVFYDEDWVSDYVENLSAADTGLASLLALDGSNEEARNIDHAREQWATLL